MWRGLSQATSFEARLQGAGREYRSMIGCSPRARGNKGVLAQAAGEYGDEGAGADLSQYGSAVRAPKIAAISSMPRRYSSSVKAALVAL